MELGKRAGYRAVVVLFCILAIAIIECRKRVPQSSFSNGGSGKSLLTYEDMAERAWSQCRKEFISREGTTELHSILWTESKIETAIDGLPPETKQTLLDCIRRKIPLIDVSRKEASFEHWFFRYAELPISPRRYLADAPPPPSKKAPPTSAPARSPKRPSPSPPKRPSPPPPKSATATKTSQQSTYDVITRDIIIASITTAVTSFLLVALFFCFCFRRSGNKNGPGYGQKDDRPLLNICSSNGSSQQSTSFESCSRKSFIQHGGKGASFVRKFSMKPDKNGSSLTDAPSIEELPPMPPPQPPPPPPPRPSAPPPPKVPAPPPKPAPGIKKSPFAPRNQGQGPKSEGNETGDQSGSSKTKLKPFFWDKVLANPDQQMVWHEISDGSFQFNEEMMESLFGYNAANKNRNERNKKSPLSSESSVQYIQIIDARKAQNLSIILRAQNLTTQEVVDALRGGNALPVELLQTLLKMSPTADEELKLRLFSGDISQLGPAERFLKALVDIPCAFKRIEALLCMSIHQEEFSGIKDSFHTLEVASNKLKNSRLFLKLLEAVLKTGNRMNDGTYRGGAQAFKLDTLLKLADVKGTDGKTTLLHFVVQEIIRSEGMKAARTTSASESISSAKSEDFKEDSSSESYDRYIDLGLQVVSRLSDELKDVKKAAFMDADSVASTVAKLRTSLSKTKEFLSSQRENMETETEFHRAVSSFAERADADIGWLLEEERRIKGLVKSTVDYFEGSSGKDEGLRLFAIVRDFLIMIDKECKNIIEAQAKKANRTSRKGALTSSLSSENRQPFSEMRQKLFPVISDRRMDYSSSSSSSDDES